MQPPKKKSSLSNGGSAVTSPAVQLQPERRKQLMASMNIVEMATEEHEPEWTWEGFEYSPTEDLLNIKIENEYKDPVCQVNGARLIIHSIYVDNFKSYKGKHQLGPLHKNLTMILGPNGSGKSNVIDALLFVFGFKSNKIRTKKLTSLIHSSDDCKHCKVEINYQMIKDIDDEKYTVIPESSFKISRSVQRDGFSQYKINDSVATLKDVHDLLKRAGIDMTHNRFLILQGEVEAIALMKPTVRNANSGEEGMLEYIEDIVGTNRFVEPIAKLAHRVRLLEMKASQFGVSVRRHAAQLETFYPVMEAALAFVNARNQVTFMTAKNHKSTLTKLTAAYEEADQKLSLKRPDFEEKEREWKEAKANQKKAENKENRMMEAIQEAMNRIHAKETEITEWHMKDAKRKASLKAATREYAKLLKEAEEMKKEKELALAVPTKARNSLKTIQAEVKELLRMEADAFRYAAEGLTKFETRSVEDKEKHKKLAEDYAKKNEMCIEVTSELAVLTSDLSELKVTAGQGEKRLGELKEALEQTTERYKQEEKELDEKSLKVIEMGNELEKHQSKIAPLLVVEKDLRSRKYALERELAGLETEQNWNSNKRHTTRVFEELKASGRFDGYIGRLGDLGFVDKKYDVAISSNFGQMDHYVMRTSEDAQFAIDYVKEHKIGRISVIDLVSVCDHQPFFSRHYPAPKLVDFVKCDDPDIYKVFVWALSDTLVVEDLAEIQKIDKKHRGEYRMCTLDGSYVDRQGNYHGGGAPTTGRIRTDSCAVNVQKKNSMVKVKSQLQKIITTLESHANQIQEHKEHVDRYAPQLRKLKARVADLTASVPTNKSRIEMLKKSIAEQEEKIRNPREQVSEKDLADKRAYAEQLTKKLEALSADADAAKKLVDACQKRLDNMFHQLVQRFKETAKEYRKRIHQIDEEVAKEEAAIQNAPTHVESIQKKIEAHSQMVMTKRIEADALGSLEGENEMKDLLDLTAALDQLKQEYAGVEKRLKDLQEIRKGYDAIEKDAYEDYKIYKHHYETISEIHEGLARQLEVENELFQNVCGCWMELEDLDPHTTFARSTDEDFDEQIAAGALLLPNDVIEKFVDYKKMLEETPGTIMTTSERDHLAEEIVSLENQCNDFRVRYDEKGITHYATLRALQVTEEIDFAKYSESVAAHRRKLQQLRFLRHREFFEALTFLGTTTQMLYQLITNGGDASLKFVEEGRSSDPFEAGVKFSVRPAKKSWKLIENLSGGEKTLASLCFVFAMHHYRATPLYVMDEIDAALDLNNVRLIANYIKHSERTNNAQFIIISLRNQMFEVGNRLIGIYKTSGCTHNVVIAPDRVENGNKALKSTLDEKIKEETKKKNAEKDADPENEVVEGAHHLKIKRRRKLRRLLLSDFGLDDDDDENDPPTRMPVVPSPPPRPLPVNDDDEEEDEPIRIKPRHQVAEEFDTEDGPTSPSPPPVPTKKPVRGRRSGRR